MEGELDQRDPDLTEEPASSDGDGEGSESEASAVEPVQAAVNHGYNLRPKRTGAGATAALDRSKRNTIAPGVGAEADNNHVGGRDADADRGRRPQPATLRVRWSGKTESLRHTPTPDYRSRASRAVE